MPVDASTTSGYTVRDQQRMQAARNYFAWQARLVKAELGPRVLEIGCGMGNFTRHLLDRECVVAIDVEPACIAHLRGNLGDPANLVAHQLDVQDDAVLALASYHFDSVVGLNVLEHVRDDRRALCHLRRLLPRGGRVVLLLPACEALYGPIDRHLGHFRRYSKASVRALAEGSGFGVARLRFMNAIGFFGWWFNARILRRQEQSEGQIAAFDRVLVPWMSRIEDRVPPPFGQSLFVVLVKV